MEENVEITKNKMKKINKSITRPPQFYGACIPMLQCFKHLGVYFENNLNIKEQIKNIENSCLFHVPRQRSW